MLHRAVRYLVPSSELAASAFDFLFPPVSHQHRNFSDEERISGLRSGGSAHSHDDVQSSAVSAHQPTDRLRCGDEEPILQHAHRARADRFKSIQPDCSIRHVEISKKKAIFQILRRSFTCPSQRPFLILKYSKNMGGGKP